MGMLAISSGGNTDAQWLGQQLQFALQGSPMLLAPALEDCAQ